MINEEDASRLKKILQNMNNCEINLEDFCDILDKESLGELTFSFLKSSLEKYYFSINKSKIFYKLDDRLFLLKHVSLERSGLINIFELYEFFSRILEKTLYCPVLSFYLVANIIEKKYKIKTLEFLYKIGLGLDRELNANDFYNLICQNLKVDETTALILFKGLDYKKKGLIKLEDFLIVIDSYRDDTVEDSFIPEKLNLTNQNHENINLEKKEIEFFRDKLENNFLTVEEIFRKINEDNIEYANHVDLYNKIKELLGENVNDMFLRKIMGFLKTDDKIMRNDLENLLVFKLDFKTKDIVQSNSLIKLNDVQIYWIKKLIILLDSIGVTPQSIFNVSIQDKNTKDRISLDTLKKKLKIMIPSGKVTAQDLNNIADSFDINKTRIITLEDYNEIITISKIENESLPKVTTKNKINSWLKESKSVNINLLPIRGNYKVIMQLKGEYDRKNNVFIGAPQNTVYLKNESQVKETVDNSNKVPKIKLSIKDNFEKGTESAVKQEHEQKSVKAEKIITPNLIFTNSNENEIFSFVNDLDVFEGGEWKFIEILEEKLQFEKFTGFITTYNILIEIKNTFFPLIPKARIFEVIKAIDQNKDGYVSIKEITKFLLKYFKHKSSKLSLKEIARKIEFDLNCSTEEFFETKSMKTNSEMAFVYFTQFFINNFEIEPPITKKIYEELKSLTNKSNILVADVIDLINEYRIDNQNKNIHKISEQSVGGEYSGLGILDKKSFETEIRNFVNTLIINFGIKLKENLSIGLNLPKTMNLMSFRESFVTKLNMDLALGITIFQLLKNFSHKDEQIISKDDLFMFLESYITQPENEQTNQIEIIIANLEMMGCPLKFPFETINYNSKGY